MRRKLRVQRLDPAFRIVLVEPEIPQNTGNIARLAVGTESDLHLCGPLGFRIDEKSVRRAGVDCWEYLRLHVHADLREFELRFPENRVRIFTANAPRSYLDMNVRPGDALVFGKESSGLPPDVIERHGEQSFGIPMSGPIRSLNLANAVGIVLYEALRRVGGLEAASPEE